MLRWLVESLQEALAGSEVDMTIFFRRLSHVAFQLVANPGDEEALFGELLTAAAYSTTPSEQEVLLHWLRRYAARLRREAGGAAAIREGMLRVNPKYVLRNYLAQQAIEGAEAGDLSFLNRLMHVLKTPYAEQPEHDELAAKRPEWASEKPGCATLSCSS